MRLKQAPTLFTNLLSNAGGYVISIVLGFIVAPITVHNLGDSRYGAWSLVSDLIGYYALLDLGMRGAVTYFVARLTAKQDDEGIRSTVVTAFWVLTVSGLVVAVLGMTFAILFPQLFKTHGVAINEMRIAISIMSCLIALGLPVSVFSAVLVGHRRFDLVNAVEVGARVLIGTSTYFLMRTGGGLISLALINCFGQVVSWTILIVLANRCLGGISLQPSLFAKTRLKELTSYGLRNVVGQVAQLVINRLDLTIVGIFAGIQFVTFYSLGALLVGYAIGGCYMVAFVFTPQLAQLHAKNDERGFRELVFRGMRLSGGMAAALCAGILIFGGPFLSLWVGPKYLNSAWTSRSDIIMAVLLIGNMPRLLQSVTRQALYATARVRFLMWLDVSEAIGNLTFSIILVRVYGPVGVAIGTLIPLVITQSFILLPYFLANFQIPLHVYVIKGIGPPILVSAGMFLPAWWLSHLVVPRTWPTLVAEITATTMIGAALSLMLLFGKEERALMLRRLILKDRVVTAD